MEMQTAFGELRSLVHRLDEVHTTVLTELLKQAHEHHPQQYQERWMPYLRSIKLPVIECYGTHILKEARALYPKGTRFSLTNGWLTSFRGQEMADFLECVDGTVLDALRIDDNLAGYPFEEIMDCRAYVHLGRAASLSQLKSLSLSSGYLGARGLAAIVESPHLQNVRQLSLESTHITIDTLKQLTQAEQSARFESLSLSGNKFGQGGMMLLARSKHLSNLKSLNLRWCNVRPKGLAAFCHRGSAPTLHTLVISLTKCDESSFVPLASAKCYDHLRHLYLGDSFDGPPDGMLASFLEAAPWDQLASLEIGFNLGPADFEALIQWPHLKKLTHFGLGRDNAGMLAALLKASDEPLQWQTLRCGMRTNIADVRAMSLSTRLDKLRQLFVASLAPISKHHCPHSEDGAWYLKCSRTLSDMLLVDLGGHEQFYVGGLDQALFDDVKKRFSRHSVIRSRLPF